MIIRLVSCSNWGRKWNVWLFPDQCLFKNKYWSGIVLIFIPSMILAKFSGLAQKSKLGMYYVYKDDIHLVNNY